MKDIEYKVIYLTDINGMPKDGLMNFWQDSFFLNKVQIGSSARLHNLDNDKFLITSTIKSIEIRNNVMLVTTLNSIYHLQAYIKKKGN